MFQGKKKGSFSGNYGGHEQFNHDADSLERHRKAIEEEGEGEEGEEDSEVDDDTLKLTDQDFKDGRTALHIAAARGDMHTVKNLLKVVMDGGQESDILHARDINNWQAVHEAARGGHLEVLMYLVERGADLSAMTKNGGTPLWWAHKMLREDHPVIKYLAEIGAPSKSDAE